MSKLRPIDDDFLKSMVENHLAQKKKIQPQSEPPSPTGGQDSESGLTKTEAPQADGNTAGLSSLNDLPFDKQPAYAPMVMSDSGRKDYLDQEKAAAQPKQDILDNWMKANQAATGKAVEPIQDSKASVSQYKEPTLLQSVKLGAKYLASKAAQGGAEAVQGVAHNLNKIGLMSDETLAKGNERIDDAARLGLNKEFSETGYGNSAMDGLGGLSKVIPAIIGSAPTYGATFYLQGVGAAAKQVEQLKKSGQTFNHHSDELFIQGSGIINFVLGKSVASTVLNKMGTSLTEDVVGTLSAEATRDLAAAGAKATSEDVAKAYAGKALSFVQRIQQLGMGALKTYAKVGTEFAGANLASTGLKGAVNAMNVDKPFNITGDEVATDLGSPFYNGETPANGSLKQYLKNLVTSPAAGLSAMHAAGSAGMLFDRSPIKNTVIENLQRDGSPENVQAIKDQISKIGEQKGWTEDEIKNTHTAVDALADIASKVPTDLQPQKFHDATNLVLGRRQLEAVLKETQARKANLDPAISAKAAPFEALLQAKIEQANDKLNEISTDKKYAYGEVDGKFYKQMPGEDYEWISKDRYDLENIENKPKPEADKSKVIPGPPVVVQSGGKSVKLTTDDVDYLAKNGSQSVKDTLGQKEHNVTLNIKNNDVADEIINTLDERDAKEKAAATAKPKSAAPPASESKKAEPKPALEAEFESELESLKKNPKADEPSKPSDSEIEEIKQSVSKAIKGGNRIEARDLELKKRFPEEYDAETLKQAKDSAKPESPEAETPKPQDDGEIDQKRREDGRQKGLLNSDKPAAKEASPVSTDDVPFKVAKGLPENLGIHKDIKLLEPSANDNVDHYMTAGAEPIKEKTAKILTKFKTANGETYALLIANSVDKEKTPLGAVRHIGKDGVLITGKIDNGWKMLPLAREHFQHIAESTLKSNPDEPTAKNVPVKKEVSTNKVTDPGNGSDELQSAPISEAVNEKDASDSNTPKNSKAEVSAERDYHINLGSTFEKVKGKPIEPIKGLSMFSHPLLGKGHGVSEESTGMLIGKGEDEAAAIADANNKLSGKTPEQIKAVIDDNIARGRGVPAELKSVQENSEKGKKNAETDTKISKKVTESEQQTEPEPEPTPAEEPQTDKQKKRAKYKEELDNAKREFLKTFNKAMAGVNPETIAKGLKLLSVYAKIGIHEFGEIVKDLHEELGEGVRDIFEGLKASYGAFATQEATDEHLDQMTDLRAVRKATIDDYLPKNTENDRASEPGRVEESTPAIPERQSAGTVERPIRDEKAEELPGRTNDTSGEVRNGEPKQDDAGANTGLDNGGDTGSGRPGKRQRANGGDTGAGVSEDTKQRVVKPADRNHVIGKDDVLVPKGEVGKFNANVDGIFLLNKLEKEDRNPTPEEKQQLAQFVGWGGLSKYLNIARPDDYDAVKAYLDGGKAMVYKQGAWSRSALDFEHNGPVDITQFKTVNDLVDSIKKNLANSAYPISNDAIRAPMLKALLTDQEYRDATNSTISAHYTDRRIIERVWNVVKQLGFKGGRVMESSAGIGHFFGMLPAELKNKTTLTGYELDSITGRILQKLYPQANVTVGGFEHARVPQNSMDLAVSNVPFGKNAPYDKNYPELSKFSMHNYFIAKNLKLLKPGGVGIMITSSSTMDAAASSKFREWVNSPQGGNSFLVGAIRLPNNAFEENAGTEVTSDILVFQKRGLITRSEFEQPFRYTRFLRDGQTNFGPVPIDVNEYYHDHPQNMLGEMMTGHEAGSGNMYGNTGSVTLKAPEGMDISKELGKVVSSFPKDIAGERGVVENVEDSVINSAEKRDGSLFIDKDKLYVAQSGDGLPVKHLDAKKLATAKAYVAVKSQLLDLIHQEQTADSDGGVDALRNQLNKDYDAFVKKYGNLNSRTNNFLDQEDTDFPIMASLENVSRKIETVDGKDTIVQSISKGDILNKRINFPRKEPTSAENVKDAINISLNYRNGIDVNYIARMTNADPEEIRDRLIKDELAFENPNSGLLETPEEYLSGNVREKLRAADSAALNDPNYKRNVAELKKIIPTDIPSSLISYSLGSSWIPPGVYQDFAKQLLGVDLNVKYLDAAGKYSVGVDRGRYDARVTNTYAAGGRDAVDLLDDTLNNRQTVIMDTVYDPETDKKKQVKNPEKTAAAQAMQQQLQDEFQSYIESSPIVQDETERVYNDIFNSTVLRDWRIPEFKHFPNASTSITLRDHQKRAVVRGLSESTLFAHEVGSGKTFTIITTAMEMRRLGTAKKPLIGVQNSTIGQFVKSFRDLYPGAKLLVPSAKEMEAAGRKRLFAKIATSDWDAIILPHSQFSMIPDDPQRQRAYIQEQINEMVIAQAEMDRRSVEYRQMESEIKKMRGDIEKLNIEDEDEDGKPAKKGGKSAAKKSADKALSIEAGMEKAFDRKTDNVLNFEQMGVDAILMDEAHRYKRLGFQTNLKNIKGIDTSKSQRSQSIMLKTRWVQEKTGGKNVNFYTGTPISNTMAEAWTFMKYIRPDILAHMGIEYFDQFAKTFGQVIPSLEQTGGGTFKVQSRFAKFQNLPEFITAFRQATDVVLSDDVKEFQESDTLPKLKNGKFTQVVIDQTPELKEQIKKFRDTLEWFDGLSGKEKREFSYIPLVIFNKAKQASIDLRLLDPTNVDSPQSKVNQAIKSVVQTYRDTKAQKGVQMIFSDMYQSPEPKDQFLDEDGLITNPAYGKARFNLFNDIRDKLVANGIPASEIAIITESKYEKGLVKDKLFDDANSGKVRILMGSTEKMGVGVNAQQKMVALHHLDAPARPMDFEQRNGRIIRQGNENKIVDVSTYGVAKTLDSSAFQRLSTKQKFINQIMKGEGLDRVTEDPADEAQMTFDEMMAQLSDSPFAMQKLLVDNKLKSEQLKAKNFEAKIKTTTRDYREKQSSLRNEESALVDQKKYADIVTDSFKDGNITEIKYGDTVATEKFGDAADAYIERLIKRYEGSPTLYAKGGLYINGVHFELEVKNNEEISRKTNLVMNTPRLYYTAKDIGIIEGWGGRGIEIESRSGTGLLASVRRQIEKVVSKPFETQRYISKLKSDIEQLSKDALSKFDDTKLKQLEKESEELKEKMLAENNKPDDEPPTPGGGQTAADYIKDQSNIKPALDFLDNMKAKPGGKLMSTIIPIPPAVWNGAIDVMKNILKATNSSQKAIRIAAKYITDKGGSDAQAKDFEQTMGEQIANMKVGKAANRADVEDDSELADDLLHNSANELRTKLMTKVGSLNPTERELADADIKDFKRKELHKYVELASVLSVDPEGVLNKDVTDLLEMVNNRRNPKTGTSVEEPEDVMPGEKRTIPKRERISMDKIPQAPEKQKDQVENAKDNYTAYGRFKDIRVRNLEQLKKYATDIGDMSALRETREYATSKSQASIIMKTATDKVVSTVGKDGYKVLREALVESRLRGAQQRFENYSSQIKKSSDNEIDDLFEHGSSSSLYSILSGLDGYEDDPNPAATILGLITNADYDGAREYMSEMFDNAAHNVSHFGKLSNGKTFDEMVTDGRFNDPKMQTALDAYKKYIEKPFAESHASNEGVFSDALGDLNTYYPLVPTGKDAHFMTMPSKTSYKAPENPNNHFTKGDAEHYSTEIAELSNSMSRAIRVNNKANAINALDKAGLLAKVSKDDPDSGYITINGETYTAQKVMVSDKRLILDATKGEATHVPARYVMMPKWLYKELKPIFEGDGNPQDEFSLLGRFNNALIKYMLGGPIEGTSHSYRLLGGIVNNMPYMQDWAYNNGILGHAGGIVANNIFVKTFVGMGKILYTDIKSDEALATIQEMAKLGVIPEKTWTKTWSKEFAELNNAEKVKPWDFSPILYGKNSLDLKARVLMYRLTKTMNPDATPEQVVRMQNELGNYTQSLQGELEKFVKRQGLAPFYSFGGAIYRSGIKAVLGLSNLPLDMPSLADLNSGKATKTQMANFMVNKMAQLLTAGIVGAVGMWALTYHAQTDKWPWEDEHSKLLKTPFPEWAKNEATEKMFYNKNSKTWDDVDMSFFNPYLNRGVRATGAQNAYATHQLGGTFGQSAEAGTIQFINTNLSPYTSSPMIQLGVTGLTGASPYINSIRDDRGRPGINLYRKVKTMPAGLQVPANVVTAAMGLNPLVDGMLSPLTGALKYKYGSEDEDAMGMYKSVLNTILPKLFSPHGNDEKKSQFIHKGASAIKKAIKKENKSEEPDTPPKQVQIDF